MSNVLVFLHKICISFVISVTLYSKLAIVKLKINTTMLNDDICLTTSTPRTSYIYIKLPTTSLALGYCLPFNILKTSPLVKLPSSYIFNRGIYAVANTTSTSKVIIKIPPMNRILNKIKKIEKTILLISYLILVIKTL